MAIDFAQRRRNPRGHNAPRVTDVRAAARGAGLHYVSCTEPGIRRIPHGKGFIYRLPGGRLLRNEQELARIRRLALPPAWKDVWICTDAKGHLLATGVDARGRKQYRYHPRWRDVRDAAKYDELVAFGRNLPELRRRLEQDLKRPQLSREKVLAAVVSVMDRTALRVGGERYLEANGSHGLTTLLDRHAKLSGGKVELSFKGKGGKPYRVAIADPKLAAIVKRCRDLPGPRLFQYVDRNGDYQAVTSSDVNRYLKCIMGHAVSAKTFRTWTATTLAARELMMLRPAETETELRRQINAVLARVAGELGNTPAICRKCYVDPRIVEAHQGGELTQLSRKPRRKAGLTAAERRLLDVLASVQSAPRRAA